MLKQVVTTLRMTPVPESVNIPFVQQFLTGGEFKPNGVLAEAATAMLAELARVSGALGPLRQPATTAA
jgi:hypothetical protein